MALVRGRAVISSFCTRRCAAQTWTCAVPGGHTAWHDKNAKPTHQLSAIYAVQVCHRHGGAARLAPGARGYSRPCPHLLLPGMARSSRASAVRLGVVMTVSQLRLSLQSAQAHGDADGGVDQGRGQIPKNRPGLRQSGFSTVSKASTSTAVRERVLACPLQAFHPGWLPTDP